MFKNTHVARKGQKLLLCPSRPGTLSPWSLIDYGDVRLSFKDFNSDGDFWYSRLKIDAEDVSKKLGIWNS
jgi:hypothetical protein